MWSTSIRFSSIIQSCVEPWKPWLTKGWTKWWRKAEERALNCQGSTADCSMSTRTSTSSTKQWTNDSRATKDSTLILSASDDSRKVPPTAISSSRRMFWIEEALVFIIRSHLNIHSFISGQSFSFSFLIILLLRCHRHHFQRFCSEILKLVQERKNGILRERTNKILE